MILVTGATGNVGKQLVPLLLGRGEQVRVLTRDRRKVAQLRGDVDCMEGDLAQPATLAGAFDDVDRVYLVTMDNGLRQDKSAICLSSIAYPPDLRRSMRI